MKNPWGYISAKIILLMVITFFLVACGPKNTASAPPVIARSVTYNSPPKISIYGFNFTPNGGVAIYFFGVPGSPPTLQVFPPQPITADASGQFTYVTQVVCTSHNKSDADLKNLVDVIVTDKASNYTVISSFYAADWVCVP